MSDAKHILVVEDEKALSQALSLKLTKGNYMVTAVGDGELGLTKAKSIHPDLIILDLIMPHMGGLEMLKKLRRDVWGEKVPVFLLTNVSNLDQSAAVYSDAFTEYFAKSDTSLDDLLYSIKVTLAKELPA